MKTGLATVHNLFSLLLLCWTIRWRLLPLSQQLSAPSTIQSVLYYLYTFQASLSGSHVSLCQRPSQNRWSTCMDFFASQLIFQLLSLRQIKHFLFLCLSWSLTVPHLRTLLPFIQSSHHHTKRLQDIGVGLMGYNRSLPVLLGLALVILDSPK